MIDKELLKILACPETHQSLAEAERELVDSINERIAAGNQRSASGEAVEDEMDSGLVREDGLVVYPIRDGIPVLLVDEGLPTDGGQAKG